MNFQGNTPEKEILQKRKYSRKGNIPKKGNVPKRKRFHKRERERETDKETKKLTMDQKVFTIDLGLKPPADSCTISPVLVIRGIPSLLAP